MLKVPEDTVYITAGKRKKHLCERLHKYYGNIDVKTMIDIIKRPVALSSNLHNAIFAPESLEIWFADATKNKKACDNNYVQFNLAKLISFYKNYKQ